MTFCLDTVIIPPENNEPIKNAVILFMDMEEMEKI